MKTVRTRFAPSPTGTPDSVHLGFVIRALWSYALAKQSDGQFILRIEDTDQQRSRKDTETAIYDTLKLFNITWDEGPDVGGPYEPYRQSERLEMYKKYAHELVKIGAAYYDFDAEKLSKEEIKDKYKEGMKIEKPEARNINIDHALNRIQNGENFVIRVKMPESGKAKWKDWILKKEIEINYCDIPDLVILKSDGFPTYHLASVIDDHEMQISHVLRGFEWVSTTPIHIFLYLSLGWEIPVIGHFPVILDPVTKKKFSKRDLNGTFGVNTWISKGYLPEALLNYLMLLGWAPKDNKEIFSLNDFVNLFSKEGIQKANPSFDMKKLDWFQGQYIRKLSITELHERLIKYLEDYKIEDEILLKFIKTDSKVLELIKLLQERTLTLANFVSEIGLFLNFDLSTLDLAKIKGLCEKNLEDILSSTQALKQIPLDSEENWQNFIRSLANNFGWKDADMFMLLRIAVWGKQFSPPLFPLLKLMEEAEIMSRIEQLMEYLNK